MADLLIRGMEMPKSCSECRMLEGDTMDGLCHAANKWLDDDEYFRWYQYAEEDFDMSKPSNCPLVELPDHGPLGDLDEIWKLFEEEKYPETQIANETDHDDRYWMIGKNAGVNAFRRVCQNLQTIIPASKEGGE